jgi:hypothetical protein
MSNDLSTTWSNATYISKHFQVLDEQLKHSIKSIQLHMAAVCNSQELNKMQ